MQKNLSISVGEQELFASQLREFSYLMQIYRAAIKEVQTKLEILDDAFNVRYEHNPIHHIEARLKTPMSIAQKLQRKGLPLSVEMLESELHDIAGIRVICNYVEDVERVASLLLAQDDITLIRRKDYISEPKDNGYRSLHLVISVPIFLTGGKRETQVEVQIRTIAMDMWASLEHRLHYKSRGTTSEEMQQRLRACSDALSTIDMEMQRIYESTFVNEKDGEVKSEEKSTQREESLLQ